MKTTISSKLLENLIAASTAAAFLALIMIISYLTWFA